VVKEQKVKQDNYEVVQISWFKTKEVTIKGEKRTIPVEWAKVLIGIYETYDEALFILRKAQGNYKKNMVKNGHKPIATFSIRRTANAVTTRSVQPYLHSLSEANNG